MDICEFVHDLSPKDIVVKFFEEGYTNRNYDFVMNCVSENYIDNSPAAARVHFEGLHNAVGKKICFEALENFRVVDGKIVESWGYWPDKDIEQQLRPSRDFLFGR